MTKPSSPKFCAYAAFLLLSLILNPLSNLNANDLKSLERDFETLSSTINELTDEISQFETKVARSNAYLDTIGSTPSEISNIDLDTVMTSSEQLTAEEWEELSEENLEQMAETLAADLKAQETMLELESELGRLDLELSELEPTLNRLSLDAAKLGENLADYVGSNPLRIARSALFAKKVAGIGNDLSKLAKSLQSVIQASDLAETKLAQLKTIVPLEGDFSAGQSLASDSSTTQSKSMASSAPQSDPGISPLTDPYKGGWFQSGAELGQAIMLQLYPTTQPGGLAGNLIVPLEGKVSDLELSQANESQLLFADDEGLIYKLSMFDGQMVLKCTDGSGATQFQTFMEKK